MVSLPGYATIRDATIYSHRARGGYKRILLLERWREPTTTEVMERFSDAVVRIERENRLDQRFAIQYAQEGDIFSAGLLTLDPVLLRDLRNKHPHAREFMSNFMPALAETVQEAPLRLDCNVGKLRSRLVRSADRAWYWDRLRNADKDDGGLEYTITLRLDDWTLMPKESILEQFLASPDTAPPPPYSSQEILALLNALYTGLPTRENVLLVPDTSKEAISGCAQQTLVATRKHLRTHAIFMEGMRAGMKLRNNDEEPDAQESDSDAPTKKIDDIVN